MFTDIALLKLLLSRSLHFAKSNEQRLVLILLDLSAASDSLSHLPYQNSFFTWFQVTTLSWFSPAQLPLLVPSHMNTEFSLFLNLAHPYLVLSSTVALNIIYMLMAPKFLSLDLTGTLNSRVQTYIPMSTSILLIFGILKWTCPKFSSCMYSLWDLLLQSLLFHLMVTPFFQYLGQKPWVLDSSFSLMPHPSQQQTLLALLSNYLQILTG